MMLVRILLALFCICCLSSCSDERPEHLTKSYGGLYIENSVRQGRLYKDLRGISYNYRYIKTVITNDSTVPARVNIEFQKDYIYQTPSGEERFKVFLLPENMTPENQKNDDFYRMEVMPFLNTELNAPTRLQKVIGPQEACTLTIGFLSKAGSELEPMPFVLFSKGHTQRFNSIPDSAIARATASHPNSLLLGLDFFMFRGDSSRHYALIPCGNFSFPGVAGGN